ncbi:MAG: outer membrane beta-barrel protein, partial [Bacteroidota bacterium]
AGSIDLVANYSLELETPGINLRSYFFWGKRACFGPEFTYFFDQTKEKDGEEITTSAYTFDFNAHYQFELIEERLGIYPILGIDFTREKEKVSAPDESFEIIERAIGMNLGIGLEVPLAPRVGLFSEYIHTFSKLDDDVVFVGLSFRWGRAPREEEE